MSFMGDEITAKVESKLNTIFGNSKAILFKKILRDSGGVIAGGSILQECYDAKWTPETIDIDIYIPVKYSKSILSFIFGKSNNPMYYKNFSKGKFADYCETFITKNGIRNIYRYNKNISCNKLDVDVDIMTVRNWTNPLKVVASFDLTFCQVWYDGKGVYANFPEDIKSKTGVIREDYMNSLLNGNLYLHNRTQKYTERGFKINASLNGKVYDIIDDPGVSVVKFKKMTAAEIDSFYNTEKRKRMAVMKTLFKVTVKFYDDSGYDSDEYDDLDKLEQLARSLKISENKYIKKFDNLMENLSHANGNVKLLHKWYQELVYDKWYNGLLNSLKS